MYLVYWRKLPKNIKWIYVRNIPDYALRRPYYKKKKINSCLMKMCMSVYGIDLLPKNLSMIQNSENLCIKESIKINYSPNIKNKAIFHICDLLTW